MPDTRPPFWLTVLLWFCGALPAAAGVLPVREIFQQQSQWCWAGATACVLDYYGTTLRQCSIAEYARTRSTCSTYCVDFGTVNCCTDATQGCNQANYNWTYEVGTDGSIEDILLHWGVRDERVYAALSLEKIGLEIAAGRPFILRWGWDGGGGHFLVGHGLVRTTVYYMNPWPGEGLGNGLYAWMCRGYDMGSYFTWTHTNALTTSPGWPSGDLNADGKTDARDQLIQELVAGGLLSPSQVPCVCWANRDFDNSGGISAADCLLMRAMLADSAMTTAQR